MIGMPRMARVVVPRAPHHVTQRGNRREDVFLCDADRRRYLSLLREYSAEHGLAVAAYCLMTNHVHLVAVPAEESSLAGTLKPVHLRYAQELNRRLGQRGVLWQGRFYSCPMDDPHAWAAVRYVERNPVRAGLVRRAEDYRWSSAPAHCGRRKDPLLAPEIGFFDQIDDWSAWLAEEADPATVDRLRLFTRTGRPAGDDGFVARLEALLGRILRPQNPGRPRKDKKSG